MVKKKRLGAPKGLSPLSGEAALIHAKVLSRVAIAMHGTLTADGFVALLTEIVSLLCSTRPPWEAEYEISEKA